MAASKNNKPHCILLYGNSDFPTFRSGGPFRIATELRNNDYIVQCIDFSAFNTFYNDDFKEILTNLISEDTLWVGISTTFFRSLFGIPWLRLHHSLEIFIEKNPTVENEIAEFVTFIKSLNPKIQLITGGARFYDFQKYGFKMFTGFNDTEIVEFTDQCAEKNLNLNLKLKYQASTIHGTEFADFHSSTIRYEKSDIIFDKERMPIEIARGCIFKCKFCAYELNGKTKGEWIKRSDVLLAEMTRNYEMFGIQHYLFTDDTYNDSVDKVKRLYDEVYSKLKFKITFSTYLRLDLIIRNPETAKYLAESGLESAVFGIETLNHASGKVIGKGINPKIQMEFVRQLKQNEFKNVLLHSGFILGLPHDTYDTCVETERFLLSDENPLDSFGVHPLFLSPASLIRETKGKSEFDLNYEKYGYKVWENTSNNIVTGTEVLWSNDKTNLDFKTCAEFVVRIENQAVRENRLTFGGFGVGYFNSLGISRDELINYSRAEIHQKYDTRSLIFSRKKEYASRLLDFSRTVSCNG